MSVRGKFGPTSGTKDPGTSSGAGGSPDPADATTADNSGSQSQEAKQVKGYLQKLIGLGADDLQLRKEDATFAANQPLVRELLEKDLLPAKQQAAEGERFIAAIRRITAAAAADDPVAELKKLHESKVLADDLSAEHQKLVQNLLEKHLEQVQRFKISFDQLSRVDQILNLMRGDEDPLPQLREERKKGDKADRLITDKLLDVLIEAEEDAARMEEELDQDLNRMKGEGTDGE